MSSSTNISSSKRPGATVAGIFSVALGSVLLLCGAGLTPTGNVQTSDVNANGFSLTNAATVSATNVVVSGTLTPPANFFSTNNVLTNESPINGTNLVSATVSPAKLTFTPLQAANNLSDLGSASTARTNLGLVPAASGNSNLLALRHAYNALYNIYNLPQHGAYFTWIVTGDSVALFKPQYVEQILANSVGIVGWTVGYVGINGITPSTTDFADWPSGMTYTFSSANTSASFGYNASGTVANFYGDTFKFYFLSTTGSPGTNTFKIQSSLNGAAWVDETNVTVGLNVTQTSAGTVTTGNTTCDTNYASVVGGVATVVKSSPGLYRFQVVRLAGTFVSPGGAVLNGQGAGLVEGGLAQAGIAVSNLDQTPAAILDPIMYDVNPTVVSLEVKDSVAIFNSDLGPWQTLMGNACPNADFIDIGTTPTVTSDYNTNESAGGDNPLGQAAILKANAATLGHFFFDSYGALGSYRNMATLGLQAQTQDNPLTSGATTLTLPAGALSTSLAGNYNGALLAIWDAGTNPLTNNHFEYVVCTASLGSNQFTVTRGAFGTTAVAHPQYSNVAAGWSFEGTHPTAPCNQFLAALLYRQLGFDADAFVPSHAMGPNPLSPGAFTEASGILLNLGGGTNESSLILGGSPTSTRHIYAVDQNNQNVNNSGINLDPVAGSISLFTDSGNSLTVNSSSTIATGNITSDENLVANTIAPLSGNTITYGTSAGETSTATLFEGDNTVGNNAPGSPGNLKFAIYGGGGYGLGLSDNLFEFQSNENFGWYQGGIERMYLSGSGVLRVQESITASGGPLIVDSLGSGLQVKEGSNAKQGTATLVAGTVTVSDTAVTANSRIFLTTQSTGGTVGSPYVSARTAGTSFTITSTSGSDTSTVAYEIFEPAP